jgi:uncharacterized protein (DUF4415 family)
MFVMTTEKRVISRSASRKASTSPSSSRRAKTGRRAKTYSISSLPGVWGDERADDIRSATLDEIDEMARRGALAPTRPDAEEIELDRSFWDRAKLIPSLASKKSSVHLRVDSDVLDWFRRRGRGHLTRMNAVLRAYFEANRERH